MQNNVIVIVGPSGSGKSTIGYIVAVVLRYRYLDVGKIWRIIGAKLIERGQDPEDERACLAVASEVLRASRQLNPSMEADSFVADRLVGMVGLTAGQLTQRGVGLVTAKSTMHLSVRRVITQAVRALYSARGTVVVGRPFSYNEAFPDAFLRVLVYAHEKLRAEANMEEETATEVAERDQLDGVDLVTPRDLDDVDAAYNMGTWSAVDLARAIATLAWQRSPVAMELKLDAI